ncbi:stage 0 sporulation family protein [Deferribacterales bacterium RsTz2092]|nr:hypothetical protein AGMMS49941_02060 [Deferribacterales bacterium]
MKSVNATGVKFKRAGKVYDFLAGELNEKANDWVVIEAEKGEDLAQVVYPARQIEVEDTRDMKRLLRLATPDDIAKKKSYREEELKAMGVCHEYAESYGLSLKLVLSEYSLDKSKLTFYYTADGRVDFRQLVRDLARVYRTRIEMRQIGVRDATKILGGFGICGRELCCAAFLRKFDNISIKTAKGQKASTNPTKISGICGRLMCCLVYEKGCEGCGGSMLEGDDGDLISIENIAVENSAEGDL